MSNETVQVHDISFSVMIDSKASKNAANSIKKTERKEKKNQKLEAKAEHEFLGVNPRTVQTWIPDDAVTQCCKCAIEFGMVTRKHHCRACGKIFCYNCCCKTIRLPRDIVRYPVPYYHQDSSSDLALQEQTFIEPKKKSKERVCDACHEKVKKERPSHDLVRIFDRMNLDIVQLRTQIALVCKDWCKAAMLSLSTFREIQYRLPSFELNSREKAMIVRNLYLIKNHGAWFIPIQKSSPKHFLADGFVFVPSTTSCRITMCNRYCSSIPLLSDYIFLLQNSDNVLGKHFNLKMAFTIVTPDHDQILYWLPHLTFLVRKYPELRLVLNKCVQHKHMIFWLLKLWHQEARRKKWANVVARYDEVLKNYVGDPPLDRGYRIMQSMLQDDKQTIKEIEQEGDFVLPFGKFCTVHTEDCEVKTSSTRPTIYPCFGQMFFHDGKEQVQKRVLVKKEDVRSDFIIMNVIKYMVDVLQKEEGMELGIVTYSVMPFSKLGGFIEIVEDASTLYDIEHRHKKTIFKHIAECNSEESLKTVRLRLVKSTAFYCVMTYLLGIGDRHLENIMITRDGRLFHIDYGFILGNDPKPILTTPTMRLTAGLVETIGDVGTPAYAEFEDLCSQIYNVLRRHVKPISILLSLLVPLKIVTQEVLDRELMRRFSPGSNEMEAKLQFSKLIEGSRTSYSQTAIDFTHHNSRLMTSTTTAIATPFKKLFSSFENWYFASSEKGGDGFGNSPP